MALNGNIKVTPKKTYINKEVPFGPNPRRSNINQEPTPGWKIVITTDNLRSNKDKILCLPLATAKKQKISDFILYFYLKEHKFCLNL